MMRRVVVAWGTGVLILLVTVLLPGAFAAGQGADCSPAPCGPLAGGTPASLPVVVDGTPSGPAARAESSVLDHESRGSVAPTAVAAAGLAVVAAALGLVVRRRRQALHAALAAPIARLEPAQHL